MTEPIQTRAGTAFTALLDTLAEIQSRYLSPEFGITDPESAAEGHRLLVHQLDTALSMYFEQDPAHPDWRRIVGPHRKALGPACADCHNPNGWAVWSFDHDVRTTYPLHGKHAWLQCEACHVTPTDGAVRASRDCIDCHAEDDAHRGSFGRSCESCHSEEAWENARLGTLRPRKGGSSR